MSQKNRHLRRAWIVQVYAATVELFHEARKRPEEAETPLVDLARKCANTTFSQNQHTIVGDKEICAREFMTHCREHIGEQINKAIAERAQQSMQENQQEALAS